MISPPKNNHRSIRFSDEIAAIIEAQEGENFNQKLENLINECYTALPEKQRQIEQLELQRKRLVSELSDLRENTRLLIGNHKIIDKQLYTYGNLLNEAIDDLINS